jgi:hypothetical protein
LKIVQNLNFLKKIKKKQKRKIEKKNRKPPWKNQREKQPVEIKKPKTECSKADKKANDVLLMGSA